jgi:altronate hydrolase
VAKGGSNLILFTTGRGSVFGSNLAPCIKVATNSVLNARVPDDVDFNVGQILEGADMSAVAGDLLQTVERVASGERTRSEEKGLPEVEFVPWQPDAVT